MHVLVHIADASGAAVKRWGECGRMGDWRRRLAAGAVGRWCRDRKSGDGEGGEGGYSGDKSLESRLLEMREIKE